VPPLITVKSFHVDASLLRLWRKHVDHVQLDGLDISIPPKPVRTQQKEAGRTGESERARLRKRGTETGADTRRETPGPAQSRRRPSSNRVDTQRRAADHHSRQADKAPKIWAIHHLRMRKMGATESWPFEATLTNGVLRAKSRSRAGRALGSQRAG
jgi:hypothetical protein